MVVSGSVKRMWENSDFPSDCSKPKYKRRKVSARRDFPKGLVQSAASSNHVDKTVFYQVDSANSNHVEKVENGEESKYDPEKLEGVKSDSANSNHVENVENGEESKNDPEKLEGVESDSANSNHVENVEIGEESKNDPEKLEGVKSDDESTVTKDYVLSDPISELPKILYARHDHPVVFYQVARKIFARRDYPEAFYANSSHFVKVEREESESEPEEIEAVASDDDDDLDPKVDKTENKCELAESDESYNAKPICSADKMALEIVGSTEPLDSTRTRGAEGKRGDYLQYLLASLDHMAATLLQMKQQGAFKKRSAV